MTDDAPFGVYVHWPYCRSICPYCDFNVYRARDVAAQDRLFDAILADIAGWRERTGPRLARSVYLGGGTPSLLTPAQLGRLLEATAAAWTLSSDCEITVEANPEDASAERFAGFRAAGANRLSLGVQAFDDAALADLGRGHNAVQATDAARLGAEAFDRVTIDLIYARTGQSLGAWEAELRGALALGVGHLSLYQLTLEPGTAFERQACLGRRRVPDEDEAAVFYELTQALCEAHGVPAYEVSNHAVSAAHRSRHNLLYWTSAEWAGVGPGAHGRLGVAGEGSRRALSAARGLEAYRELVARNGWGVETEETLDRDAQRRELAVMGLRLVEGVDVNRWTAVAGSPPDPRIRAELEAQGVLAATERLRLTPKGRLVCDYVAGRLAD